MPSSGPGGRLPSLPPLEEAPLTAPATLAGLETAPCDPLILAVRGDGRPLHGLTGRVDWRVGARLSALVREGVVPAAAPLLLPPFAVLPVGRLVLWRASSATPAGLVALVTALAAERPGLCSADFDLGDATIRSVFGDRTVVLYTAPAGK